METNELIGKLLNNKAQALMSFIAVAYIEFKEDQKNLSEKVKWYLLTAELILSEDPILSSDEKDEFTRLHLLYIAMVNERKTKIPLMQILDKFESGTSPIEALNQ